MNRLEQIQAHAIDYPHSRDCEELAADLELSLSEFEDMLPYVSEYFRHKWGYDDFLQEMKQKWLSE